MALLPREELTLNSYSAEDQGKPAGSPNWCQCDQYTVPLLTHTTNGLVLPQPSQSPVYQLLLSPVNSHLLTACTARRPPTARTL